MGTTWMRRWVTWTCVLLTLAATLAPATAQAAPPAARLSVRKVKGADFLGRVAGVFRVAVDVPENVRLVTFYLDGQPVARVTRQPFVFQLDTRDFPSGEHRLEAVAHLSTGAVTTSNSVWLEFRSQRWRLVVRQSMFLYAGLLLVLCVVAALALRRLLRIQPRLVLLDR